MIRLNQIVKYQFDRFPLEMEEVKQKLQTLKIQYIYKEINDKLNIITKDKDLFNTKSYKFWIHQNLFRNHFKKI